MREFFSRFLLFACCVLVPVASGAEVTPMDRAVTDLLRRSVAALRDAAVLKRLTVDNDLDLVLAIGWPRRVGLFAREEVPWSPQDRMGAASHFRMRVPAFAFAISSLMSTTASAAWS
jgi:hypothetical protein